MKSINNKVLIKPNYDHKRSHTFSNGLEIIIDKEQDPNYRTKNQQEGILVADYPKLNLKKGDTVWVQHMQFFDSYGNRSENTIQHEGEYIAVVSDHEIYFKINPDESLTPVGEYIVCNEVKKARKSELLIEDEMEEKLVEVEMPNPDAELNLKKGDHVYLIDHYSKYPFEWQGKNYVRIREEEIIAIKG